MFDDEFISYVEGEAGLDLRVYYLALKCKSINLSCASVSSSGTVSLHPFYVSRSCIIGPRHLEMMTIFTYANSAQKAQPRHGRVNDKSIYIQLGWELLSAGTDIVDRRLAAIRPSLASADFAQPRSAELVIRIEHVLPTESTIRTRIILHEDSTGVVTHSCISPSPVGGVYLVDVDVCCGGSTCRGVDCTTETRSFAVGVCGSWGRDHHS